MNEFTHLKSAAALAIARCGSNSAIWIAFNAAPFKSWSAAANIAIE
jgi:hypothetical protein